MQQLTTYRFSDNKDKPHKHNADFKRGKTQNTLNAYKTKVIMFSYTLLDSKLWRKERNEKLTDRIVVSFKGREEVIQKGGGKDSGVLAEFLYSDGC